MSNEISNQSRLRITETEVGQQIATSALREDAVATGARIGAEAVATTRNLRSHAIKELLGRLDRDHEEWKDKIAARLSEAQTEDGLTEETARDNWAAKVQAFIDLGEGFGLHEVTANMSPQDLAQSFVVGLTASGSYVMLGPNNSWNSSSKEPIGDGLFAMTYIEGRKGLQSMRRGGSRPDEIRASAPAHASRVVVYTHISEINNQTGRYEEDWEKQGQMPNPHDKFLIFHDQQVAPNKPTQTSELLKVMYITNPQDAQALMLAYDSATTAVNQEVIAEGEEGVVAGQKLTPETPSDSAEEDVKGE